LCSRELGPFDGLEDPLVQWSATLVAAVTLNCFIWLLVAVAVPVFEVEFMPEFAPADAVPFAEAVAPVCPADPGVALALADEELSEGVPVS
jgi:hypothetical protein